MKKFLHFLLLALALVAPVQAATLYGPNNFNSGTLQSNFPDYPGGASSFDLSSVQAHSGSQSLRYRANTGESSNPVIVNLGNQSTVFARWWWWIPSSLEGFQAGAHSFRIAEEEGDCYACGGELDTGMGAGATHFDIGLLTDKSGGVGYPETIPGYQEDLNDLFDLPQNQWFKFEILTTLNTTAANGILKVWVNDVLVYNNTSVQYRRSPYTWTYNLFLPSTNIDNAGAGSFWYIDDLEIYNTDQSDDSAPDTTAPTLSLATAGTANSTGATAFGVSTDEPNGTLYWAVVTNGGSATDAQLKAGTGGNIVSGKAGNQAVVSTGAQSVTSVAGLSSSTTYQIKYLHQDAAGNDSTQASVSLTTTAADVTAPTLTSPSAGTPSAVGTVGANVSTNEAGGTLYWAVVTNGGSCTDAQLKAGTGGNIVVAGSQSVLGTGTQTISGITSLSASTAYQIKFLHRDTAGNDSAQASVNLLTTAEDANPPIWVDNFETDKTSSYYERNTPGGAASWGRSTAAAFGGSWSLRSVAETGSTSNSNWWVGFGKLPAPSAFPNFFQPPGVDTTTIFRDVTVSFRHMASVWPGTLSAQKLMRLSVFANSAGAQAAALHLWSYSDSGSINNNERLQLDPVRGTDAGGTLLTTTWNDIPNFTFIGSAPGTTHVYSSANFGHWFLIAVRMRLNDPGQNNGIMELWIDGVQEVSVTNLNWLGSYATFGINTVHIERYWNSNASGANVSYFDDLRIVNNEASAGCAPPCIFLPLKLTDLSTWDGVIAANQAVWDSVSANDPMWDLRMAANAR